MKKILGGLALASVLVWGISCNSKKDEPNKLESERVEKTYTTENQTAKNSLNFKGTYKGTTPCADCEKIEVELKIGDNDYERNLTYYKNNEKTKVEEKGTYTWDEAGNIITLEGVKDSPNKYLVSENQLTQLDMDGNVITGELANNYILRK